MAHRRIQSILIAVSIMASLTVFGALFVRYEHAQKAKPLCDSCTIIVISLSAFGAEQSSITTPGLETTPELGALANASGIVFERAYASAPGPSSLSNAAMLTGKYPWDIGMRNSFSAVPSQAITLAETLSAHEYDTRAFSGGILVQSEQGFDQGFEAFTSVEAQRPVSFRSMLDSALSLYNAHNASAPLFLYIHSDFLSRPFQYETPEEVRTIDLARASGPNGDEEVRKQVRTAYRNDLAMLDTTVSAFIRAVQESPQGAHTIVALVGGTGIEFRKGSAVGTPTSLSNESIHVPLVLFIPDQEPKRIQASVETRSLYATLLSLVGISVPKDDTHAPSLTGFITGTETKDQTIHSRIDETSFETLMDIEEDILRALVSKEKKKSDVPSTHIPNTHSVIMGVWQAIKSSNGDVTVFNLAEDRETLRNLYSQIYRLGDDALPVALLLLELSR